MALENNTKSNIVQIRKYYLGNPDWLKPIREKHSASSADQIGTELEPLLSAISLYDMEYLEKLPGVYTKGMKQMSVEVQNIVNRIENYLQHNFDHQQFLNEVRTVVQNQAKTVMEISVLSAVNGSELKSLVKSIEGKKKTVGDLIDLLKETTKAYAVEKRAELFETEAGKNIKESDKWLISTGMGCALIAILTIFNLWNWFPFNSLPEPQNNYDLVRITMSKLLLFGTVSFATFFCAKNYTASRHNSTVNRHRQLSLQSYKALVELSEQSDVILHYAAQSIYSHQSTGYTPDNVEPPSLKSVVELLPKSSDG